VLVHANAFNTMHQRTYLRSASVATVAAIAALLALLVATATLLTRPWIGAATAVASGAALIVAGSATAARGTLVDALTPLLGVAVTFTIAAVARELLVDRQRRRLAGLFTQYVPPRVAREIIASNRTSELLDGARLDVTVVFCDIRGFTPATAVLDAPQVRALLDSYYQELSAVVLDHGGTVLQYTGDEILAVFGARWPSAITSAPRSTARRPCTPRGRPLRRASRPSGCPRSTTGSGSRRAASSARSWDRRSGASTGWSAPRWCSEPDSARPRVPATS
jgi:adenylate cyclase